VSSPTHEVVQAAFGELDARHVRGNRVAAVLRQLPRQLLTRKVERLRDVPECRAVPRGFLWTVLDSKPLLC
jgi:hypothetical protein